MTTDKSQLSHILPTDDKRKHRHFCDYMQEKREENVFENCLVFGGEAILDMNGKVNKHKVRL